MIGVEYRVGQLVDVYVMKFSSNRRTCNFGVDPKNLASSSVSDSPPYHFAH